MSEKALRTHLIEIEWLVADGQLDEALASGRHILHVFPKNLATYRLLGQAHLARGDYSESADLFLRLLSSIPDDFTAHLALALLRERENKCDVAHWHMQRAFESNPASETLRDEVARLSGQPRQAGTAGLALAPLSRAALARMYLAGGCFPQAIAEIQAALFEEPARDDLRALLAAAYEQAGEGPQAREASKAVLARLPYCLQANRILFMGALQTGDDSQVISYRQRLQELDPYWAYVNRDDPNPENVPAEAIII